MKINFVKFSKDVICPTKGSVNAAGFDFYSVEDVIIPPSNGRIVQTNVGFKIPKVYFRKVHARSSFGTQFKDVGGGVIDSDYRGRIVVVFFNFFYRTFDINEGCCFAQTIYRRSLHQHLQKCQHLTMGLIVTFMHLVHPICTIKFLLINIFLK